MAAKVEMRNYSRTLTDSEIANERIRFVDDALQQKKLEEELDNISKDYKERIKGIEKRSNERLEIINSRKKSLAGNLYGIANQAEGRMMFYDKYGELIDSRDLLPEERQGRLFDAMKKDTDDLPLETQQVVSEILKENGAEEVQDAEYEEVTEIKDATVCMTDEYLANMPHDESGWGNMNDKQLMKKYGTTSLQIIRTMEFDEEKKKYVVKKAEAKKPGRKK